MGTMMWAYGVPFHITHGPPLCGSVDMVSSIFGSGTSSITCAGLTTHWLLGVGPVAKGSLAVGSGFALSWLAASLLRRVPGVARIV